jgi:uncharacterized Zn-finger protein
MTGPRRKAPPDFRLSSLPADRYGALQIPPHADTDMADHVVPHFHNDVGAAVIEIGAKEFMCIGATPPFDHPHVFCDMGDEKEFICSYCSTLYRFNPELHADEARPAECAWVPAAA